MERNEWNEMNGTKWMERNEWNEMNQTKWIERNESNEMNRTKWIEQWKWRNGSNNGNESKWIEQWKWIEINRNWSKFYFSTTIINISQTTKNFKINWYILILKAYIHHMRLAYRWYWLLCSHTTRVQFRRSMCHFFLHIENM